MNRLSGCFWVLLLVSLVGCELVGPAGMHNGHRNYADALEQLNRQQLLRTLVRLRYRDTSDALEVTSIATNVSWNASIGSELGFGLSPSSADSSSGHLGLGYAESPTISFSPLRGKRFVQEMITPIRISTIVMLCHSGWRIDRVMRLTLDRLNGLPNATMADDPLPGYPPEYQRFVASVRLLTRLQAQHRVFWHIQPGGDAKQQMLDKLVMQVPGKDEQIALEEARVRRMLGLKSGCERYSIVYAIQQENDRQLAMQTRSMMDVLMFLSRSVELPDADAKIRARLDSVGSDHQPIDWHQMMDGLMRVHSARGYPEDAYVSVYYRGHWFYIRDDDTDSKSTFLLLSLLMNLQAGEAPDNAPQLVLPVG